MKLIRPFQPGEALDSARLNEIVAATNAILGMRAGQGLKLTKAAAGFVLEIDPENKRKVFSVGDGCPTPSTLLPQILSRPDWGGAADVAIIGATITAPDDTFAAGFQNEFVNRLDWVNPAPKGCRYFITVELHGFIRKFCGANGSDSTGDRIQLVAVNDGSAVLAWRSDFALNIPNNGTNLPADGTLEEFSATIGPFAFDGSVGAFVIQHFYFEKFERAGSYVEITGATLTAA